MKRLLDIPCLWKRLYIQRPLLYIYPSRCMMHLGATNMKLWFKTLIWSVCETTPCYVGIYWNTKPMFWAAVRRGLCIDSPMECVATLTERRSWQKQPDPDTKVKWTKNILLDKQCRHLFQIQSHFGQRGFLICGGRPKKWTWFSAYWNKWSMFYDFRIFKNTHVLKTSLYTMLILLFM